MLKRDLLATTMLCGAVALVLAAAPAAAQTTPVQLPPAPAKTPPKPARASSDGANVDEVVVTGSRIRTNVFTSTSPVQVITAETSTLQGVADTGRLLQMQPIAAGSVQINGLFSTNFVLEGGAGVSTISLRGLGANRTLVLLNGRRAGPAGVQGQVSAFDLNVIPESAIDHVEILKDGASSIYGSDAVAGVVNIITKDKYNGGEISAYTSQPQKTGGEEYRIYGSYGRSFDHARFSVSADYYEQQILTRDDRDYLRCNQAMTFSPTTGQRTDVVDPVTGKPKCENVLWGQIFLYDYDPKFSDGSNIPAGRLLQYFPNGAPAGPNTGVSPIPPRGDRGDFSAPPGWFLVDNPNSPYLNDDHPFVGRESIVPKLQRATAFATAAVDVTDKIEAYGEFLLNRRKSAQQGWRQVWSYDYTHKYDPLSKGFHGPWLMSPTTITDRSDSEETVDYARAVAGLRGDVPLAFMSDWKFDLYYQYSHSHGEYTNDVILNDAVDAGSFRSGSCVGTITPISHKPCVDVAWTTPRVVAGQFTPEEEAFLFDRETGVTTYTQQSVEASINGSLFSLPAGPVSAALGLDWRRDEILDTPGPVTLAKNSWGLESAGITAGEDTVKEAFGELQVPILKDLPLIESLTASASARWTDYASYGSSTTYKVGLNWQITPSWRIRATQGTSFRAPALYELFLADQTNFLGQRDLDPCVNYASNALTPDRIKANCAAAGIPGDYGGFGADATVSTGGGFGRLKAETSKARTLGVIWTPHIGDFNFSLAVDYFDIEVKNEVTALGGANILFGCYNSQFFPSDPLCSLFTRNPNTLNVLTVTDNYINVADQSNKGLDVSAHFKHDLPWGVLSVDGQYTWQLTDTVTNFPGFTVNNNGTVGDPQWVGNTQVQFDHGPWTVFWGIDMVGHSSDAKNVGETNSVGDRIKVSTPFVTYHDLSIRRKIGGTSLLIGMQNVFDKKPPTASDGTGQFGTEGVSVFSSQYDYIGRRAFVQVTQSF